MKKVFTRKMLALLMMGGFVMQFGGSCNGLPGNIWKGFGYGVGGLPAGIVTNLIADVFGIQTGN